MTLGIVPEDEKTILLDEIKDLTSLDMAWARVDSKGSSLAKWDLIESTYLKYDEESKSDIRRFSLLLLIMRAAHSLPPPLQT